MKNRFVMLAIAAVMLTTACKKETTRESNTNVTELSQTGNHEHSTTGESSKLMASMDDMMEKMHNVELSGNSDFDLAAMMQKHHESAVDMADILLKSGSDSEMKQLAQKIKEEQDKEIGDLQKIQDKYKDAAKNYDPKNSKEGLGKAMANDMKAMMNMPESAHTSIDKEFAVLMMKHHQDGIQMAKTIAQYAKDEKFKAMAQSIITSQQQDVKVMEQWLEKQS